MTTLPDHTVRVSIDSGPHAGLCHVFCKTRVAIGRDRDNDVALFRDSTVSGHHATLSWAEDSWSVQDSGSKNGTFIVDAGNRLLVSDPVNISDRQVIFIGSTRISVGTGPVEDPPDTAGRGEEKSDHRSAVQLRLSISNLGDTLRYELASTDPTIATYDAPFDTTILEQIEHELEDAVAQANSKEASTRSKADDIESTTVYRMGRLLRDQFVPEKIQQKLKSFPEGDLIITLDPSLLRVPWEFTLIDNSPCCLRYNIGRQIVMREHSVRVERRQRPRNIHILIACNPTNDLPQAQQTSEALFENILQSHPHAKVSLISGSRIRRTDLLDRMSENDIVYYMGHAEHDPDSPRNSAWLLEDGRLTCEHLTGLKSPPTFIFANACESGKEADWPRPHLSMDRLTGMVSGILGAGVSNYLGARWTIAANESGLFASSLMLRLLDGYPIGASIRFARQETIRRHGVSDLVWPSYVLYGDPARRFT